MIGWLAHRRGRKTFVALSKYSSKINKTFSRLCLFNGTSSAASVIQFQIQVAKNKSGVRKRGLPVVSTAVFLWSLWGKHGNSCRVKRSDSSQRFVALTKVQSSKTAAFSIFNQSPFHWYEYVFVIECNYRSYSCMQDTWQWTGLTGNFGRIKVCVTYFKVLLSIRLENLTLARGT